MTNMRGFHFLGVFLLRFYFGIFFKKFSYDKSNQLSCYGKKHVFFSLLQGPCLVLNHYATTNKGATLEKTVCEENKYFGRGCKWSNTNLGLTITATINLLLGASDSDDNNLTNGKALWWIESIMNFWLSHLHLCSSYPSGELFLALQTWDKL